MSARWRWLADLRVSVRVMASHRGCDQMPWVRSDGWFCGGCGTRWGLDGRITPRMSPHTAHTRWPRPAAWGDALCLRFAGWLDYWDTKLADACNEEEE